MTLVLALALLAAAPAASGPDTTTLDAIRAAPDAFEGKWVRLRGQIDQCFHFECAICPEEATPADPQTQRCLRLSWDRQRGSDREHGADFDPIYRYASVDLVARFEGGCLKGMCTDRASVLLDARVLAVLKRRPSAEGLNARRGLERMVDAPEAAARPLIDLLSHGRPGGPSGPHYRVFADPSDPNLEKSAIVCRSSADPGDPGAWPVDQDAALFARSTEDWFKCFIAEKSAGQWFVHPD
jgi:hypothetical protein